MNNYRSASRHVNLPVGRRQFLFGAGGAAGLLALGSTGLLAACGTSTPAAGPVSGDPVRGGTLRAAFAGTSAAADLLDPHAVGHSGGGAVSRNVWDRLVEYNNDLTLRFRLAESLEPNADGTRWRINIRPGVEFSDGSPLTSQDVVWSLQRMLEPDSPAAGDLAMVDMSQTRADGELAVEVAMNEPLADFGSVLAGWYVYVIKDGTTEFSPDVLPAGTGPFVLESWSPGDRTRLSRNEKYWDGTPYLDGLEILQVSEIEARMNSFRSGDADVVYELSPLQAKTASDDPGIYVVTPPSGVMASFQMRVDVAPFDDVRVRQALRLAVDREAIAQSVYYGFGELGNDLYGKGAPFYNDELPQRSYDPEQARALLREAGKENLRVTLHTADASPGQLESATLFAEQAKAAGITVNLETVPADTYFSQVAGKEAFTQSGWWNYSLDYFYGQSMTTDSPANATGWQRPEWDEKFFEARAAMDENRRRELYFELQEDLWNEGGSIIHTFALQPTAVRNNAQGIRNGVPGTGDWANFSTSWVQG